MDNNFINVLNRLMCVYECVFEINWNRLLAIVSFSSCKFVKVFQLLTDILFSLLTTRWRCHLNGISKWYTRRKSRWKIWRNRPITNNREKREKWKRNKRRNLLFTVVRKRLFASNDYACWLDYYVVRRSASLRAILRWRIAMWELKTRQRRGATNEGKEINFTRSKEKKKMRQSKWIEHQIEFQSNGERKEMMRKNNAALDERRWKKMMASITWAIVKANVSSSREKRKRFFIQQKRNLDVAKKKAKREKKNVERIFNF